MMMGDDVCGDCKLDFFHRMACYALTMNNCGKLREVSNEVSDWIFPQFQAIKDTSFSSTINKMLQFCVGKVGGFKSSDTVGTSIRRGSADDMVLNTTLDFFRHHSWQLGFPRREPYTNLSEFFKHCLYAGMSFKGEHGVTAMIYTPKISAFVDENIR